MQFGMISWYVRLSLYPAGYGENPKVPLSFVALASQKSGAPCVSLLAGASFPFSLSTFALHMANY